MMCKNQQRCKDLQPFVDPKIFTVEGHGLKPTTQLNGCVILHPYVIRVVI